MSRWIEMLDSEPGANPPRYVADTSALARLGHHVAVRESLLPLMREGRVGCAEPTWLEIGLTARNRHDHAALGRALGALHRIHVLPADFERAWEVQAELAAIGQHRGVALPDLLIAACAERLGLTVIHCDADFDLIAEVTGQPTVWAVARDLL